MALARVVSEYCLNPPPNPSVQDFGLESLARLPKGPLRPLTGDADVDDASAPQRFAESSLRTLVGLAPIDVAGVVANDLVVVNCKAPYRAPSLPLFTQVCECAVLFK